MRRIELDRGARDHVPEIRQIHLKRAHAEGQQVDQLLADPALDIDPVEAAAHERLGYAGGEEQGPPALCAHGQRKFPQPGDEFSQPLAVGPALAGGEDDPAGKVQFHPIKRPALDHFAQVAQDV